MEPTKTFNIVLAGSKGCGKESLFNNLLGNDNHDVDIGGKANSTILFLDDGSEAKLKFWKYSQLNQDSKNNIVHSYVIVFDTTSLDSFESLSTIKDQIFQDNSDATIFIMGNKIDLDRCVSYSTAQDWCDSQTIPMMYFETSAVTGKGVAEAFSAIANVCSQSSYNTISPVNEDFGGNLNQSKKVYQYGQYEQIDISFDYIESDQQPKTNFKKAESEPHVEMIVLMKKLRLERNLQTGQISKAIYDKRISEINNINS